MWKTGQTVSFEDNRDTAAFEELHGLLEVGEPSLGVVHDVCQRPARDVGIVPDQGEAHRHPESAAQTVSERLPPPAKVPAWAEERLTHRAMQAGDVRDEPAVEVVHPARAVRASGMIPHRETEPLYLFRSCRTGPTGWALSAHLDARSPRLAGRAAEGGRHAWIATS